MFDKLKNLFASNDDEINPVFTQHKYRPGCSLKLVGDNVLLFMGFNDGTSNGYCTRLDLPKTYLQIAERIFDALAHAEDPLREGGAGDPPYYVVAAGMKDEKKFHKNVSDIGVTWIKKIHKAGNEIYQPGIYLYPCKRLRRTGSFESIPTSYYNLFTNPIPPEDHERIGREVMELFDIIRTDFDGGPLPLRQKENAQ